MKHFVFKLQKNARSGDAFASDCSSWKTYKELGCTKNKEESTCVNGFQIFRRMSLIQL